MAKNIDEKQNIHEAIKAFGSKSLSEAGINLFSTLGYDTSLQAPLDNKTFAEFKEIYIESSANKERFSEERAFCSEWKSIDILFQLTDDSFSQNGQLFDSKVNPLNPQSYLCFAVELDGSEWSKTKIATITREINKLFAIPILVIFKYGECITLAVINRRVNKRDSDRDVLEKVTLIKDIFFEKPHRAHIEILFDMSLVQLNKDYAINNFETLHKAWSEVLDTQTLNKRFYTELSNWYFWAIKTVVYPGSELESDKGGLFTKEEKLREHNAKNLIRLLTRLLFVWFIKEKDLIPEELFDEKQIKEIITNFEPEKQYDFSAVQPELKSIYYKAILQNLFFASLNAEHGKRAFRIDGQNQNATSLMRYQRYHKNPEEFVKLIESKVPFMNGGLFECLDHQDDELKGKKGGAVIDYEDGFSDRKDNELFVPDYVFFGKDVKVDLSTEYDDKKKKDVTVNGIINILQKYKFTIAENTPVEEDIALDPELLGRVFENLLASYNPETKTNARKQTGSFYTPRPIVEYMVDESLKAYLKTKIKDSALSKGTLEEKTKAVEELENTLDSKLDNLIAYNETEPEFTAEERFQILRYIDECKILDPACGSGAFPMGILQKMVYLIHKLDPQNDNWKQIQIQKISNDTKLTSKEKNELQKEILTVFDDNELDYARKLYLIENCIHGIDIQPIATQISRLRFFISLIVDQKVDNNKANFGVRPLPNLENRFVTANSLIGLDDQTGYLAEAEIIDLKEELKTIRHKLFSAKSPSYKFELKQKDKEIRGKMEQVLLDSGFGKQNASMISTWDPYDKNKSADFFDSEWMFGVKDGFDVVIGNPPYVQLQGDGGKLAKIYENQNYVAFAKTGDIYCLFYEKGFNLLNTKGLLCFITSNKWMRAGYGEKLRDFFAKNVNPILLVDFAGVKVFDSATVDTNIMLFEKAKNSGKTKSCIATSLTKDGLANLSDFVQQESTELCFNSSSSWVILSPIEQSIKAKIEKIGTPLKDWDINIYRGVLTGFNDAFIISGEKRKEILDNCKSDDERKRTDDLIRPILRGRDIKRYEYNFADLYLINAHNGVKDKNIPRIDIKDYPAIKNHLDEYWDKISTRADKGDTPYNLRNCAYMDEFNKPKIVWGNLNLSATYTLAPAGMMINAPATMIVPASESLLCILNSKIADYYIRNLGVTRNGGYFEYKPMFIEQLPVPKNIDEKLFKDFTEKELDNEEKIDRKVYELYGLTAEEIKFIENI
ncbi:Eco57I restriction-modification methylase domain-containing protein [uncultured Treponema sp.]|uniref:Eco57I restriction-modification methylase domain-containing protein n=1 Tax=uncultured Treponema sp. TaxID=162155 RepID=UPI0026050307|nr:Eco57I restriction-modification methylase domain-containing protein [uncultured Treponema sp.]